MINDHASVTLSRGPPRASSAESPPAEGFTGAGC
jgi:hypothetical protein